MSETERRRYVKLMVKAIELAATSHFPTLHRVSKTNGLRVIRSFDRVNGVAFEPGNQSHLDAVRGMGRHEEFFRRVKHSVAPQQNDNRNRTHSR